MNMSAKEAAAYNTYNLDLRRAYSKFEKEVERISNVLTGGAKGMSGDLEGALEQLKIRKANAQEKYDKAIRF